MNVYHVTFNVTVQEPYVWNRPVSKPVEVVVPTRTAIFEAEDFNEAMCTVTGWYDTNLLDVNFIPVTSGRADLL